MIILLQEVHHKKEKQIHDESDRAQFMKTGSQLLALSLHFLSLDPAHGDCTGWTGWTGWFPLGDALLLHLPSAHIDTHSLRLKWDWDSQAEIPKVHPWALQACSLGNTIKGCSHRCWQEGLPCYETAVLFACSNWAGRNTRTGWAGLWNVLDMANQSV